MHIILNASFSDKKDSKTPAKPSVLQSSILPLYHVSQGNGKLNAAAEEMLANSDYSRLYGLIIGLPALEVFYMYDLDKVNNNFIRTVLTHKPLLIQNGFISPEEIVARNFTEERFKSVDSDNDGFIVPYELDSSLMV